jgi:C1A family cysteine protease
MPPKLTKLEPGQRRLAGYGWHPDLPDQRDLVYAVPHAVAAAALPAKVDLRPQCPPVYDQGQLGSCTANAIAGAIEFDQIKLKLPEFTPSRLFIYYNERVMEHDVSLDNGAQIRDGIKSVAKQGVCSEKSWPYDDQNMDPDPCPQCPYAKKPTPACYAEAAKHKVLSYQRLVSQLNILKGCLASGYTFVFGFTVYESFESEQVAKTGIVPMPGPKEKVVGGHAVVAVGYDDSTKHFIVRNSWATTWGLQGYFMMPYAYLTDTNLADDLWTIRLVQ